MFRDRALIAFRFVHIHTFFLVRKQVRRPSRTEAMVLGMNAWDYFYFFPRGKQPFYRHDIMGMRGENGETKKCFDRVVIRGQKFRLDFFRGIGVDFQGQPRGLRGCWGRGGSKKLKNWRRDLILTIGKRFPLFFCPSCPSSSIGKGSVILTLGHEIHLTRRLVFRKKKE